MTSTTQPPGSLGSLAGADAICAARAMEAGLTGHFVAWLSVTGTDAVDRLAGARGWYRTDGFPFMDMPQDLANDEQRLPLRADEHGRDVGFGITYAATGSFDGTVNENCNDFTSPSAMTQAGFPFAAGAAFGEDDIIACNIPQRLYCFQTDFDLPLVITPATGRRAFVSNGMFTPSSGRNAADAVCATDATNAGLTGTFLALLPDATTGAAARFDIAGAPWVRGDGIALADTAADYLNEVGRAPLNTSPNGTTANALVLVGTDTMATLFDPPDPSATCNGWTNAGGTPVFGNSAFSGVSGFAITGGSNCTTPVPVYCLEQ